MLTVPFLAISLLQAPQATSPAEPPVVAKIERNLIAPELRMKLKAVKRIYIDDFGQDADSKRIQAMIVEALVSTKKFVITESKENADAILRGAATENSFQEFHSLTDKASAGTAVGSHSGSVSGNFSNGSGTVSGSSYGGFSATTMSADDSTSSSELIREARTSVRLVAKDGDVIWATTQESKGGKYRSASADVAFKVQKQLMRDLEAVETPVAGSKP